MSGNPNQLIHESSPYLLQHAYNPVNWFPWNSTALNKARTEDKPIILSIGYSSCHWCHVMERESFENQQIAEFMNEYFVCIKVDREERPDIDHIYMDAVQSMGIRGGWPLNVFLTPEQNAFYGGTYFPPETWIRLLQNVIRAFNENREDIESSSRKISSHLNVMLSEKYGLVNKQEKCTTGELKAPLKILTTQFDRKYGGLGKSPKFPMPAMWLFLMRYSHYVNDNEISDHVRFTLQELAKGGICDQIGGGFCRYSVDEQWLVPHFEKMLYDNGQLIGLFSEAYRIYQDPLYKKVVYETIQFIREEMTNPEGGFYAALDADSDGEEGKYYTWTSEEIDRIFKKEAETIKSVFDIQKDGNWEQGRNVLRLTSDDLSGKMAKKLQDYRAGLLKIRLKRTRPGLDDKILAGWNGITLHGLIEAYMVFHEKEFLNLSLQNAEFIRENLIVENQLYRTMKSGKPSIPGYLEDYAFVIQAFLRLYEATFDEKWLFTAENLLRQVIENFYDPHEGLFYFSSGSSESLVARNKELFDNVIPSSNSVMAQNLLRSGHLLGNTEWIRIATDMVSLMSDLIKNEPGYMSNWGNLYLMFANPLVEIAITGEKADVFRNRIDEFYFPNRILCGTTSKSKLPLLKNRISDNDDTTIYICFDNSCKLPVSNPEDAIKQLKSLV